MCSSDLEVLDAGDSGLFAFVRRAPAGSVVCLFNVTEQWRHVPVDWLRDAGMVEGRDLLSGGAMGEGDGRAALPPYARAWVV